MHLPGRRAAAPTDDPAPGRRPSPARARSAAGWAATAAVVAALVWFGWPSTLGGCTTLTVVSGHSMEPTYRTGDLVVARCGVPQVGEVVVYTPPEVGDGRVIHRLVAGDATGWAVQGDNNDFLDPWHPTDAEVLGIARLHLPGVGRIAAILLDPWAWASLIVLAGGVALWPARDRWDHRERTEDGTPATPAAPAVPTGATG